MSLTPRQADDLADQIWEPDEESPEDRPAHPAGGQLIGRYQVLRRIASGGMGTVYEARQENPPRLVALKVMRRDLISRMDFRRFEVETRVLAHLNHPRIAQIYESGTHDDGSGALPFFAMEYVPNARNLIEYAETSELSLDDRLELFAEVCDAVHHGHQKGVIHRDLKPSNILIDESGHPKIIDFGVARVTESDIVVTTMTDVGVLVGTLQYMSPEQCEAEPNDLDVRTDIYALGVVLYELLCEKLPYDLTGTSVPKATRIVQEVEPVPPGAVKRRLRGNLETITLKALEKDREQRFSSASELAANIRRHLRGEPLSIKQPTILARVHWWIMRHPIAATGGACLSIALLTILATFSTVWYINARPDGIEVIEDGRRARLLTAIGRPIHTWDSGTQDGIRSAEFVQGDRNLVLIGYGSKAECEHRGSLCVFTLHQLDEPLWTARITDSDIADSPLPPTFVETQFGIAWAGSMDIFDDPEGPEIVAIHKDGPSSPIAVRIYDLAGAVLYEVWHDGPLNPPYWMKGARLLLFSGLNGEVYWDARGHARASRHHPYILLAVKPAKGHRSRAWLTPSAGGDLTTVAWYKCFLPPETADQFRGGQVRAPFPSEDRDWFARYLVELDSVEDAGIEWLIDKDGAEVPGTRVVSDAYKRTDGVPDPELPHLGQLPPVISPDNQ